MSSDFNFTVTSWFLGNVRVKPYFNTQCPRPVRPSIFRPYSGSKKKTYLAYAVCPHSLAASKMWWRLWGSCIIRCIPVVEFPALLTTNSFYSPVHKCWSKTSFNYIQKFGPFLLKVSKFRKQIMVSKLLPKTNQTHYPGRLLPQG